MTQTVETCAAVWALAEIPRARIAEMRAELERHLRDAARDGKPPAATVGPDVIAFAQVWAQEDRPAPSWPRRIGAAASTVFGAAAVVAALGHLRSGSGEFPVSGATVGLMLLIALGSQALLWPPLAGRAFSGEVLRGIVPVVALFALLTLAGVLLLREADGGRAVLLTWPWPATAALLAAALVALRVAGRSDPASRPGRW